MPQDERGIVNMDSEPIVISQAAGLVVSTGVAMVAILCGCLTAAQAAAVVGFGNAVVALCVTIVARKRVTPIQKAS